MNQDKYLIVNGTKSFNKFWYLLCKHYRLWTNLFAAIPIMIDVLIFYFHMNNFNCTFIFESIESFNQKYFNDFVASLLESLLFQMPEATATHIYRAEIIAAKKLL